jgi:AraC family transcriptional regulator
MGLSLSSGRFPVRITASREVAGFVVTETRYLPNQKLSEHSHQYPCFVAVIEGTFTESYDKKTRSCGPSSVIFRPPEEVHANHFHKAGGRCLTVEITPRRLEQDDAYRVMPNDSADFHSPFLAMITTRLYHEFCEEDHASRLAIEGLILEMMAETSRCTIAVTARKSRRTERAREILHEQFSDHLSLSKIARMVEAHPVYLAREFRRQHHCTIGEYLRRLRIQSASRQLSDSDLSIVEIALSNGFPDQSHFSKTFKRLMGRTPSQYRATFRRR